MHEVVQSPSGVARAVKASLYAHLNLSEVPYIFAITCMQHDGLWHDQKDGKTQAEEVFQEMKSKKASF
jgi:catabolite regulation protein CreA